MLHWIHFKWAKLWSLHLDSSIRPGLIHIRAFKQLVTNPGGQAEPSRKLRVHNWFRFIFVSLFLRFSSLRPDLGRWWAIYQKDGIKPVVRIAALPRCFFFSLSLSLLPDEILKWRKKMGRMGLINWINPIHCRLNGAVYHLPPPLPPSPPSRIRRVRNAPISKP